jgi:uncharacterized protein (DUF433 family)
MKGLVDTTIMFSLREAAVLSRLPEDRARREVERKVIEPKMASAGSARRLLFAEPEVLFFAMLNSLAGTVELTPPARTKAWRLLTAWEPVSLNRIKITPADRRLFDKARLKAWTTVHRDPHFRSEWVARLNREWSKSINAVFTVSWDALIEDVGPRIDLYREGLKRIREDEEVLGGEAAFKGTRLAVRHIGGMRAKGEPVERIVEDYPELTPDDVEFARLYTAAHPLLGRPKAGTATA